MVVFIEVLWLVIHDLKWVLDKILNVLARSPNGLGREDLENIFSNYISNPVKSIEIKGKNKNYLNYRLKTISSDYFNKYYEMFYKFDFSSNKFIKIFLLNFFKSK